MAPQRLSTQKLQHCEGDELSLPDFHYSQPQGGCPGGLIQRWSPLVAQEKGERSETWGIPHTAADWGGKGLTRGGLQGLGEAPAGSHKPTGTSTVNNLHNLRGGLFHKGLGNYSVRQPLDFSLGALWTEKAAMGCQTQPQNREVMNKRYFILLCICYGAIKI